MLCGPVDSSPEEQHTYAGAPVFEPDDEAGDPPCLWVVVKDPTKGTVAGNARKARTRYDAGPSDRVEVLVFDASDGNACVLNLLAKCHAVVRDVVAPKALAPARFRIARAWPEHGAQPRSPIGRRGIDSFIHFRRLLSQHGRMLPVPSRYDR